MEFNYVYKCRTCERENTVFSDMALSKDKQFCFKCLGSNIPILFPVYSPDEISFNQSK